MITLDRFALENQLVERLPETLLVTWLRLSDRLKRSLLLAGGFMDLTVLEANVNEINNLLNRCPPNSQLKAEPNQRQESVKP